MAWSGYGYSVWRFDKVKIKSKISGEEVEQDK